jgi:hypothetical protein
MALFGEPVVLWNIDDTERFASRIIERRRLDWLLPHERDDLVVFLVETAWKLSLRYEPMGFAFSQWVRPTLDRRVTDWLRREFFDARYVSQPPELVPLDTDDLEHDRLGAALTGSGLDRDEHRLADELRSLEAKSPSRWAKRLVGLAPVLPSFLASSSG